MTSPRKIARLRTLLLSGASLVAFVGMAHAQSAVDQTINDLAAEGYTRFEVSRGIFSTEIEAYGPGNTKTELRVSNSSGDVLSRETAEISDEDYTARVSDIEHGGERRAVERDDDDDDDRRDGTDNDDEARDDDDGVDDDGPDDDGPDDDGPDDDGPDDDGTSSSPDRDDDSSDDRDDDSGSDDNGGDDRDDDNGGDDDSGDDRDDDD